MKLQYYINYQQEETINVLGQATQGILPKNLLELTASYDSTDYDNCFYPTTAYDLDTACPELVKKFGRN